MRANSISNRHNGSIGCGSSSHRGRETRRALFTLNTWHTLYTLSTLSTCLTLNTLCSLWTLWALSAIIHHKAMGPLGIRNHYHGAIASRCCRHSWRDTCRTLFTLNTCLTLNTLWALWTLWALSTIIHHKTMRSHCICNHHNGAISRRSCRHHWRETCGSLLSLDTLLTLRASRTLWSCSTLTKYHGLWHTAILRNTNHITRISWNHRKRRYISCFFGIQCVWHAQQLLHTRDAVIRATFRIYLRFQEKGTITPINIGKSTNFRNTLPYLNSHQTIGISDGIVGFHIHGCSIHIPLNN